jgi:hypothetical protein
MPPPKDNKNNHKHLIFVKNIPQESAPQIVKLYTQYKPIEVKNLYPTSRITTFLIALLTAEDAANVQQLTNGLRLDNTIVSVERYNAKQSTVARRETRRKQGIHGQFGNDQEEEEEMTEGRYEAGGSEQDDVPEYWKKEEIVPCMSGEPSVYQYEVVAKEVLSWADIAKGSSPPSPSSVTSPVTGLQRPTVATAGYRTANILASPTPATPPRIMVTAATASLRPRMCLQGLPLSVTPFPNNINSILQCSTPSEGSKSEDSRENCSQDTQAPNIARQQSGTLSSPTDTTAHIQNTHGASCAFCQMRMRVNISGVQA